MNERIDGLLGENQRRLERLARVLNEEFGGRVEARVEHENLVIESGGRVVWLDKEFRVSGESNRGDVKCLPLTTAGRRK